MSFNSKLKHVSKKKGVGKKKKKRKISKKLVEQFETQNAKKKTTLINQSKEIEGYEKDVIKESDG